MNLFFDTDLRYDEDLDIVNTIVEIPKGGLVKYEYNIQLGALEYEKMFPSPGPNNYGMIPKTWNNGDDDALDIIIISSNELIPGCVAPVQILGGWELNDHGEQDNKIVGITMNDDISKEMIRSANKTYLDKFNHNKYFK